MAHRIYYNLRSIGEDEYLHFIGYGGYDTPLSRKAGTVFLDCNCDAKVADECPVQTLMYVGAKQVRDDHKLLYSDKLKQQIFGPELKTWRPIEGGYDAFIQLATMFNWHIDYQERYCTREYA